MNSYATTRISRAKRTILGRTFCRVLGDQAGQVLLEYVILGVLIAAAAVFVVAVFGRDIGRMFGVMSTSIVNPNQAQSERSNAKTASDTEWKAAKDDQRNFQENK